VHPKFKTLPAVFQALHERQVCVECFFLCFDCFFKVSVSRMASEVAQECRREVSLRRVFMVSALASDTRVCVSWED
jgi:hypothetical protein